MARRQRTSVPARGLDGGSTSIGASEAASTPPVADASNTTSTSPQASGSSAASKGRRNSKSAARAKESPSRKRSRDSVLSTEIYPPIDLADCIPLGTLSVPAKDANHNAGSNWQRASHLADILPESDELADVLTQLDTLKRLVVTYRVSPRNSEQLLLRVYILSDDRGKLALSPSKALSLSQSHCRLLLSRIDGSKAAWNGQKDPDSNHCVAAGEPVENKSLFYFYNTLPSPELDDALITYARKNENIQTVLSLDRSVPGLKTKLYPYQQRSAALMIRREENPEKLLDPRLQSMTAADGSIYYHNPSNAQFLLDRREFPGCRGGILAETMGLGKTLICLAVILATKYRYPDIRPAKLEPTWPANRPEVASLMEMAAAAAARHQAPWKQHFDMLQKDTGEDYGRCLAAFHDHPRTYIIPAPTQRSPRRGKLAPGPRTILLTTGTLIISPVNLVQQWNAEISKHTEPGGLKVLSVDDDGVSLPPPKSLLDYDIVLMSRTRFDKESPDVSSPYLDANTRYGGRPKHAPYCDGCSGPTCTYKSALREIHWKRIIVDEGHCMSSTRSQSVLLAKSLLAECRWLVTGTPTSGLVGVEVGLATVERDPTLSPELEETEFKEELRRKRAELANARDRDDLANLGLVVKGFLQLQPWSLPSNHPDHVSWLDVLREANPGPVHLNGPIERTLREIFIKHRPEDVRKDMVLPPLKYRIVYLEPSYFDKASLNLFTAFLIVNAVTSERTDEDYMFHPQNWSALNELISNLRRAGFFWCGVTKSEVKSTIRTAKRYLDRNPQNCPPNDRRLLNEAIQVAEEIISSPNWESFQYHQELGCFVDDFPPDSARLWNLHDDGGSPLCMGLTALAKAQKAVHTEAYSLDHLKVLWDAGEAWLAERAKRDSWKNRIESRRKDNRRRAAGPTDRALASRASQGYDPLSLPVSAGPNTDPTSTVQSKSILKRSKPVAADSEFSVDSPLGKTRLIGTASRKLSYLLDQIRLYQENEKILCFYEGDYIAYYLSQALDVCQIPHLIYANGIQPRRRAQYVVTFNTTETFRVLLMDLRHAAHGLNLSSASRVYFINPVWRRDIEAQAIKRAHRIGQLKPVYVETLVLKGTLEEKMLQRRKSMTQAEQDNAKDPLHDRTMRDIFENAQLMPTSTHEAEGYHKVARLAVEIPLFGDPGRCMSIGDDPDAGLVNMDGEGPSGSEKGKEKAISPDYSPVLEDEGDPAVLVELEMFFRRKETALRLREARGDLDPHGAQAGSASNGEDAAATSGTSSNLSSGTNSTTSATSASTSSSKKRARFDDDPTDVPRKMVRFEPLEERVARVSFQEPMDIDDEESQSQPEPVDSEFTSLFGGD